MILQHGLADCEEISKIYQDNYKCSNKQTEKIVTTI
jgi:hypothetical protein